jgi:hypothetical protein
MDAAPHCSEFVHDKVHLLQRRTRASRTWLVKCYQAFIRSCAIKFSIVARAKLGGLGLSLHSDALKGLDLRCRYQSGISSLLGLLAQLGRLFLNILSPPTNTRLALSELPLVALCLMLGQQVIKRLAFRGCLLPDFSGSYQPHNMGYEDAQLQ